MGTDDERTREEERQPLYLPLQERRRVRKRIRSRDLSMGVCLRYALVHEGSLKLGSDSGLAANRGQPVEKDEEAKGSLGLNLLYDPADPVVDFVFVQGLGGGSRKTWSKSSNIKHFWPRWLAQDSDFQDVRIHSFGYNSDWASMKQDVSNISDFALSLLNALQYSDTMRKHSGTPIVFIVHSMRGLVVKKAFLLARQDAAFQDLAALFRIIVFLATPHRGSDGAHVINSVLRLSFAHTSRQYVEELERNSTTL